MTGLAPGSPSLPVMVVNHCCPTGTPRQVAAATSGIPALAACTLNSSGFSASKTPIPVVSAIFWPLDGLGSSGSLVTPAGLVILSR